MKSNNKIKKIFFYGNFGVDGEEVFDGQRTKARNVSFYIREKFKSFNYSFFNTNFFKKHPIINFFKLIKQIGKTDFVFIYPGSPISLSIVLLAIKLTGKSSNTFYPVVGGFLGKYCVKHKLFAKILKKFCGIFCETKGLVNELESVGFKNVFLSPVFTNKKQEHFNSLTKLFPDKSRIRFCTFGRVCREKGIENAIKTVALVREKTGMDIILDIYGKTYKKDNFENDFRSLLNEYSSFVTYKGPLPNDSFVLLSTYHYMLFPTYFYGEGFPACVLESFLYATPVIASNWKYNKEFVNNNTGYIFDLEGDSFFNTLIQACAEIETNNEKKYNAYVFASSFSPEKCLKPITDLLNTTLEVTQ